MVTNKEVGKLKKFMENTYPPGLHMGFAALWFLSLEGLCILIEKKTNVWIFNFKVVGGIVTLFLVLFYLRVIDEIKDYAYDKIYNPDRPLITGLVNSRDLTFFLLGTALLVMVINWYISWVLLLIVLIDMIYGLMLVGVEKISAPIKNSLFLNMLVTYPVNIALSIYIYFFFLTQYNIKPTPKGILVILSFALAFLQYEFSRKTSWPHHAQKGKRLYSEIISAYGSSFLSLACALAAMVIAVSLARPYSLSGFSAISGWLMLLPVLPAILGVVIFLQVRPLPRLQKGEAVMIPYAEAFLVLFYITLIVHAFVVNNVLFLFT